LDNPDQEHSTAPKNEFMKKRIVLHRIKDFFHIQEKHSSRFSLGSFTLDIPNDSVKLVKSRMCRLKSKLMIAKNVMGMPAEINDLKAYWAIIRRV
jgi:hypothetical protein